MNEVHFWQLIQRACRSDSRSSDDWRDNLIAELVRLPADEILAWDQLFERYVAQAYTIDLMAACYLMNTGAGDDGFYYFRCWLVGMGHEVYSQAMLDPDSLVRVALPYSSGIDAEAEIYGVAYEAWRQVTGNPETVPYPVHTEPAKLTGDDWEFEDREQMWQHLPRLFAFYED